LPLLLALGSCSGHPANLAAPAAAGRGLPVEAVAPAIGVLDFSRFVVQTIASVLDEGQPLDRAWTYDPANGDWLRIDRGTSTGFGEPETRTETTVSLRARFLRGGAAVPDYLAADRVRLELEVRQRRFAADPNAALRDGYDVTLRYESEFALDAGHPDAIHATGTVSGWADLLIVGRAAHVDYAGGGEIRLEYANGVTRCAAESWSADVAISVGGVVRDRYRGTIGAAAGEESTSGALESERGPGRYAFGGHRGPCLDPADVSWDETVGAALVSGVAPDRQR